MKNKIKKILKEIEQYYRTKVKVEDFFGIDCYSQASENKKVLDEKLPKLLEEVRIKLENSPETQWKKIKQEAKETLDFFK